MIQENADILREGSLQISEDWKNHEVDIAIDNGKWDAEKLMSY